MFVALTSLTAMVSGFSSVETDYANIYADQLIDQFDSELDQKLELGNISLTESKTYAKLIAAREFIEKNAGHGGVTAHKKLSLLTVKNSTKYSEVVEKIDSQADMIHELKKEVEQKAGNVIYPSSTRDGNLTGNTFPKNTWSLTFDDGPHASRTNQVLDNLHANNMKASFFVLMKKTHQLPHVVDDIIKQDMELALHSYTHANLTKLGSKGHEYEITTSKRELEDATNVPIQIFRLPYGAGMRNTKIRDVITRNQLVHIFWNVDTLDWKDKNPQSIFNRTIKQMKATPNNSGIILFHDIHAQTVIASRMVMEYLNEQGKTTCTVGEVINYLNNKEQDCLK
tara:strand:+ start:6693 stop:7712 length:1020 start_codon:yes stop_codon:yes gene_type:complete